MNSSIAAMIPLTDKPGPPAAFDISEITNESCCLAWNAPRDDGGSPVTNYIVEMRPLEKDEWQKLSATVKQTNFKACKLVAMKEYVFRVSAENQFGIGTPVEHAPIIAKYSFGRYLSQYTFIVSVFKLMLMLMFLFYYVETPGSPSRVQPSDISKDAVTLTWYEPDEDGGSPITGYWVERFDPETDKWIKCNKVPVKDTTLR